MLNRADASHDLALGEMPVANQPLVAIIGLEIGVPSEEFRNLGLDRPRQQRTSAVAPNFSKRIGEPRFANIKTSSRFSCRNPALELPCFLW